MVCEVLDRKFVRYIAFDNDPAKAIEARNRGLPVFYGDVSRPEVLQNFHVGDARMVRKQAEAAAAASKKRFAPPTCRAFSVFPELSKRLLPL